MVRGEWDGPAPRAKLRELQETDAPRGSCQWKTIGPGHVLRHPPPPHPWWCQGVGPGGASGPDVPLPGQKELLGAARREPSLGPPTLERGQGLGRSRATRDGWSPVLPRPPACHHPRGCIPAVHSPAVSPGRGWAPGDRGQAPAQPPCPRSPGLCCAFTVLLSLARARPASVCAATPPPRAFAGAAPGQAPQMGLTRQTPPAPVPETDAWDAGAGTTGSP